MYKLIVIIRLLRFIMTCVGGCQGGPENTVFATEHNIYLLFIWKPVAWHHLAALRLEAVTLGGWSGYEQKRCSYTLHCDGLQLNALYIYCQSDKNVCEGLTHGYHPKSPYGEH